MKSTTDFQPNELVWRAVSKEYGVVTSTNDKFVFVKYFNRRYLSSTSQATNPEELDHAVYDDDVFNKIKIAM